MTSGDRFKEAVDLTTGLDLPEDTALPAQRKRHASLILKDVVDSSEGGMERAALATVFGVCEYTESKIFWESQNPLAYASRTDPKDSSNNDRHTGDSSILIQPNSTSGISQIQTSMTNRSALMHPLVGNIPNPQHGWQSSTLPQLPSHVSPHSQQSAPSYLNPIKKVNQLQHTTPGNNCNNNNRSSNGRSPGAVFTLPDIPVVSKFDDWLTTHSQVLSSKARIISPSSVKSSSPLAKSTHHSQQQQHQQHQLDTEVAPPLVFLSYPPAIFDLLKSDTDDRIIIWGPDPQFISVSGATVANYSMASSQPVLSKKLGFSSNTTTGTTTQTLSIHSGASIRGGMKSTAHWIRKAKESIHYPASSSSSSSSYSTTDNNGTNALTVLDQQQQKRTLQSRLGRRLSLKKDQHRQLHSTTAALDPPPGPPPMVIQAATVEKLVEKLTLTLDYTFMTDFFLTYRTFISPTQLCKLLILRFQWGLENDEDDRRVVRIRTFVVIRHWLLNYFVHDFTSSLELRKTLTLFLNTLPSHSLIKHSLLDQRIVKGLKRVVRRLKKIYYPKSSQRVQVVSPPPPNFDQEQVRGMLHVKLSQGPLRCKTEELIHKDMTIVNNWHHDNVTFQDARKADIVVVGSSDKSPLPPARPSSTSPMPSSTNKYGSGSTSSMTSTRPQQQPSPNFFDYDNSKRNRNTSQNSVVKYAVSTFLKKRLQRQELRKVKESYLHRMEQQKRVMMDQQQQQELSNELDHDSRQLNFQQNLRQGVTSDVSLDSIISPGMTDDELYDKLEEEEDSAVASDDALEMMEDGMAQLNGYYQEHGDDDVVTRNGSHQATIPVHPAIGNAPHRRSVYNAVLSDLSPLVSPSGSVIHGPLVHSLGDGFSPPARSNNFPVMKNIQGRRQLTTPSSSMDNMLRLPMELNMNGLDHDKTESAIADGHHCTDETPLSAPLLSSSSNQHMPLMKNRVSKALLENGEEKTVVAMDEFDIHDEKALDESTTSMSFKSLGSLSHKPQNGSELTTTIKLQHRRLSHRLINAFRSAGNIRRTRAMVVQPEMMISSTAASSIQQNSFVAHDHHHYQHQQNYNKPDSPPQPQNYQRQHGYGIIGKNSTAWASNQSTVVESHKPHQHLQHQLQHQHQHADISYLKNIRASLEEDRYYYLQNTIEAEERDQHQQQQQSQRRPELDTMSRRSTDNIPPSLSALFKPSIVLQHRSHALAQQFCLVEKWIFLQIDWEELMHCRWTKMGDSSSSSVAMDGDGDSRKMDDGSTMFYSRRRQWKSDGNGQEDGVEQLINRFNTVCQWVSSEIVRTLSLDERVLVIEKFIRLAQKCHMYSNFATLVQILLGLQSPSVSRLGKTWSKVADSEMRLLEQLSSFTSPMKNWKHIRDSMTVMAEEYGMSPKEIQIQLPVGSDRHHQTKIKLPFGGCIPFLGLYLSDLVFNSEQPSYLEPNHDHHKIYQSYTQSSRNLSSPLLRQPLVNFMKHRITATIIKRFLTFRDLASRYSFEQVDSLYADCFYLESLETDTLSQLSMSIEPPPPS